MRNLNALTTRLPERSSDYKFKRNLGLIALGASVGIIGFFTDSTGAIEAGFGLAGIGGALAPWINPSFESNLDNGVTNGTN